MSDFIGIDIKGIDELSAKFDKLPPAVQDSVVDDVTEYMLNVLREYPPQKSVSRKQAYGRTFQSRRQQRWFFANLNAGKISVPHKRTQGVRRDWRQIDKGADSIIVNENPGALWTMDNQQQARLNALVGWKKVGDVLRERQREILRKAEGAIKKGMHKAGFK
jgi:hypothetical protein